ncbi:MAG TPA: nickel-dependent hydrogenase large subunit [Gryllotalpicola sp.]
MVLPLEFRAVTRDDVPGVVAELLGSGHRVASVVARETADGFAVRYVLTPPDVASGPAVELGTAVPADDPALPSLAALSHQAGRFEREIADLFGIRPLGHPQPKRLVKHAHWPESWAPMRGGPAPAFGPDVAGFPFAEVAGSGVFEIAVGPVHAGIIEPGHFRFSVVGETIVRMEPRLWFLHRGVEKVFEGRTAATGLALAERIAGDTPIGHGLAFALAAEQAAGYDVPEDAQLLRALLLELERLINHVTDLGALANDTGFGIGNVHALRLRERLARLNDAATGHRLLRGALRIGGASLRALPAPAELTAIAAELGELTAIIRGHGIVRDRFTGTGVLPHDAAVSLGTLGYVARASGIATDARRELPFVALPEVFDVVVESGGDVLARFLVREREAQISASVAVALIERLAGRVEAMADAPAPAHRPRRGLGLVEAWRGALTHHVELGEDGTLERVKVVDPSFFNWPALPVALAETIVPDFPLTNKSFNQSYAGNDL